MKLLTIFLVAIACISQSECKPGIFDVMGNMVAGVGEMTAGVGKGVHQITSGIGSGLGQMFGVGNRDGDRNSFGLFGQLSDGFNNFKDSFNFNKYVELFKGKFDEFKGKSTEFFKEFSESFMDKFNAAKKQIAKFTDEATKQIFGKIQEALEAGHKQFGQLSEMASEKFEEFSEKAKKAFEKMSENVKEGIAKLEEKMSKLSSAGRRKAQAIIKKYKEGVAEIIEKCRGKTMEPIRGFFDYSKTVLNRSQERFSGILNQIRDCYYNDAPKVCGEKLVDQGKETFNFAKEEASQLKKKISEASYEDLAGVVCVSDTLKEIRNRREQAQDEIEKLK